MIKSSRFIVVLATLGISACGLFLSEEAQFKRALEARDRGDFRAASIDLKSLLEKNPAHREARFNLGIVTLEMGEPAAAARDLERARTDGAPAEQVVEPLARAYIAQGEYDKALELVNVELAKFATGADDATRKSSVRYLLLRGQILAGKRDLPAARQSYEAALAVAPDNARALLGMVGVVEATDGSQAALPIADRAVAADAQDPTTHLARAALLMRTRQTEAAADSFTKAAEVATGPTHKGELLSALGGLAQAQIVLGKKDAAVKTSLRMEEVAPNTRLTRYTRGYVLAQTGELDKAREVLEPNLAQGDDPLSRLLLGAIDLQQGRLSQAEMHLSSVVASIPNNPEARQLLAQVRLRQAKPAEALDTILPAVGDGKSGNSVELLALAAQANLAAGKTKEGVELLKRSAAQNPDNTRVQLDLAAGYLAAGQADQALTVLNSVDAGKVEDPSKNPMERLRREYLGVLARLQKGDAIGATTQAVNAAKSDPNDAALQSLASAVMVQQRRFAEARPFAEAALKLQPNDAASYINLGRLDVLEGNLDAARKQFRTALEKRPGDAMAATALAAVEVSQNKSDAALAVLSEARKHNAKSVEPRLFEAQLLLTRGKMDEAEKLAREALELEGNNPSAIAALGRVLSTKGQHNEALTLFERAVREQPKNVALRYQLAVAQRMAGRIDDALKSTGEVLAEDPRHVPAMQLDGILAVAKGDLQRASKHVDALMRSAPDQAATHELLGFLRRDQKRYPEAAAEFRKAGELAPRPHYAIAEFEIRSVANLANPEEPLERFLSSNPNDAMTRLTLAQAQQARGDRAAATRSYEMVLATEPRNVVALNNLAWLKHEDGKNDAVELARRAHSIAPDQPAIVDTYAWILVRTGKVNDGLKLFDGLYALESSKSARGFAPEIGAHYAYALSQGGRLSEAKKVAQEVNAKAANLNDDLRKLIADLLKS